MTSGCHTQVVSEISLTLRKKQVNPRSVLVCGKERGCSNPLLNTQRDALWLLAGSLLQFQLRMGRAIFRLILSYVFNYTAATVNYYKSVVDAAVVRE